MKLNRTKSVLVRVPRTLASRETSALLERGRESLETGEWQEAEEAYKGLTLLVSGSQDSVVLSEVYCALGIISEFKGRYDNAVSYYVNAAKIAQRNNLAKIEALLHMNLGHIYSSEGRWEEARLHHGKAIAVLGQLGNEPDLQCKAIEHILDIEAARVLAVEVLGGNEEDLPPKEAIDRLREKAHICISMTEWQKAEAYLHSAIKRCEGMQDQRLRAILLNDLACVLKHQNELDRSRVSYEAAMLDSREVDDRKTLAITHNNLGLLLKNMGDYDLALTHFRKSLELKVQIGGQGDSNTLFNIASMYFELKEYDIAQEHLEQAIELDREGDKVQLEHDLELLSRIQRAKKGLSH